MDDGINELYHELQKLGTLKGQDFIPNYYKGSQALPKDQKNDEATSPFLWPLPSYSVITRTGRRIVGRDPNISSSTLNSLIISDSKYISDSLRHRLSSTAPEQLAKEEFMSMRELGVAHLAQCIKENLNQTKADLVAVYSDDRRLPFVVGAIYIDAFMQTFRPFYYCYYPSDGYSRKEWKPRKAYIQLERNLPPEKRELKKYYKSGKIINEEIAACPICGSPAHLFRVGYRGKDSQVCCTDPSRTCKWFMGAEVFSSEIDAIHSWNRMCLKR